jgi:transcriptional regulator with XRE-family HTH domain
MSRIAIDFSGRQPYADLAGRHRDPSTLSAKDRRLVLSVVARANKGTPWPELSSHWRRALIELHRALSGKDLVRLPVYAICQDIASRVGIEQGYFRQRDYRDDLVELIAKTRESRYQFAKETGLNQAFLSRVLSKRAHLSVGKLEKAAETLGYRVALVRSAGARRRRARSPKGTAAAG